MTADRARVRYTICDDCGNSTLEHDKAVWTTDGASYCPTCRPMTADRRAALVEAVAQAISNAWDSEQRVFEAAEAAIDLIRAEVLEEAARECGLSSVGLHFAAAIRALVNKNDVDKKATT